MKPRLVSILLCFCGPLMSDEAPFLLAVRDVFQIKDKGTVVTGLVERGFVHVGDPVEIVKFGTKKLASIVGIEQSKAMKQSVSAGDEVGLLLGGQNLNPIERGNVIATPNSIQAKSAFKAVIYWFAKTEGGRHMPVFKGYAAQYQLRTATINGTLSFPPGVEMALPGSSGEVNVKLDVPVPLNAGLQFSVREGTRIIAHGLLTVPSP